MRGLKFAQGHKLDLSSASSAALAELRAYYVGTMGTMGWFLWRYGGDSARDRMDGHKMASCVLGLFAVVRCYSHYVDGPTNNLASDIMWTAEAVGAVLFLWLYGNEQSRLASKVS